jgi:hypothetical protein
VADNAIDTARDQGVPRLDSYQPAEPTAEHKDWPDSQCTTGSEQSNAKPANGITIEGPEFLPVRVGRQIGGQQPDQAEGSDDPTVATILTLPWAQISAGEKRCARQREEYDRECDQRWLGEESRKSAPAEHRYAEIGNRADNNERQAGGWCHHS